MEKSNLTDSVSVDDDLKAPNLFERAKEEIDAILHSERSHHHKETHGLRDDIDVNTPLNNVKAPNVFERAKEEIDALVQTIHSNKHINGKGIQSTEKPVSSPENDVKAPNLIDRAKEEIVAIMHHKKEPRHHHKENHGMSDDIGENTPLNEVKAPNVFERAKEEIEAIVQTIHPKKESSSYVSSPNKEGGLGSWLGRVFEKVCSPWGT